MRAKTKGIRLITLSEGTLLVPTHDFVNITDGESTHEFTQRLVESEEIVLSESVVKENLTTETVIQIGEVNKTTEQIEEIHSANEEHIDQTEDSMDDTQSESEVHSEIEQSLRASLNEKNKSEIIEILAEYGISESDRTKKDVLIEKVVEIARENNEL